MLTIDPLVVEINRDTFIRKVYMFQFSCRLENDLAVIGHSSLLKCQPTDPTSTISLYSRPVANKRSQFITQMNHAGEMISKHAKHIIFLLQLLKMCNSKCISSTGGWKS